MAFNHDNFRRGQRLEIVVGGSQDGQRLDNYLCIRFSHLSRVKMQRIIRGQGVEVNGAFAKPSRRVHFGDILAFDLPDTQIIGEDLPLDIIYEDDNMLVINKDSGFVVHPARGNSSGTVLNGLIHYAQGEYKPDLVHRLDKNTSGVMVVSKNQDTNTTLSEQFVERTTSKCYIAIVHGSVEQPCGTIEKPISSDNNDKSQYFVHPDGRHALTLYKVLKTSSDGKYSLLEVDIKTGRTHQIRVHLSHIGHPIVADTLYGGKPITIDTSDSLVSIERCALHAHTLKFDHPITGKPLEFVAPLKPDMQSIANELFD